jgi:hypothetical protein
LAIITNDFHGDCPLTSLGSGFETAASYPRLSVSKGDWLAAAVKKIAAADGPN